MNTPVTPRMESLGSKLGQAAMEIVVRSCRKEIATASHEQLEAVCAAMRARAKPAIETLLADYQDAPWIAEHATFAAIADLADAGISVLRKSNISGKE